MEEEKRTGWFLRAAGSPEQALIFEMGGVYWGLKAAFARYVGLPRARLRLLGMIHRAGSVSQAELQRQLEINGSAVTRQVKQLEAEGWVVRRPDPADNRFTLVALTDEGSKKLAEVADRSRSFMALSAAGIDPADIATVRRVFARLRENIQKVEEQAAP